MPIIRTQTDFADEPLVWRKSAQLTVYCRFLFKEIGICTILSENHQEGEQIIFMDIRVLLNANNRTKTDFADEPLIHLICRNIFLTSLYFWRKSAQLSTVYCRFLFKEIGKFAPFYRKITKRESKSFSWILEYSLMQIIVPKQILLMSL